MPLRYDKPAFPFYYGFLILENDRTFFFHTCSCKGQNHFKQGQARSCYKKCSNLVCVKSAEGLREVLCLPLWKGHFNQTADGKMSFGFVVLLLLHLHEIVSLKPSIIESSDTREKHVLCDKQENTAAGQMRRPLSQPRCSSRRRCPALEGFVGGGERDSSPHSDTQTAVCFLDRAFA